MSDTIIRPDLVQKLKQVASEQSMNVEEFIEAAIQTYLRQLEQDELQKNITAYEQLEPHLLKEYSEQYVAVAKGEVVDHDEVFQALHRRIRVRFGRQPVLIRQVSASGRILNFHSPQIEQSQK
jgi:predicted transcriptional regulator